MGVIQQQPGRLRPAALGLLVLLPAIAGCPTFGDSRVDDTAKRSAEIAMLTYVGTTTYHETPEGPAGFEYDLAKAFADHLGLDLRVVVADTYADVLPRLRNGEADFAAANIPVARKRPARVRFTPSYQQIRQHVVYRLGNVHPAKIEDLIGREIEVQAGTVYAERLHALKQAYPWLEWIEVTDRRPEEHLQLAWEGLLDLTLADSNLFAVYRRHFPELQIAFSLPEPQRLAWAFRPADDDGFYEAAVKFLEAHRHAGAIARLLERYYGPASSSDFVNLAVFRARVRARLPLYQEYLEEAGKRYDLDWRLLAAMAYQESYWDPQMVSPTGVRGFMMLTRRTAAEVGVDDRKDAQASIDGGARYLRSLLDRVPERIGHPDRAWLALAAYNAGSSRVEAARVLTQRQGGDPDRWNDVKRRLPQLSDPEQDRARYGYFRGEEPVRFVDRVRVYRDVLVKMDEEERARGALQAFKLTVRAL